MKGLNDREYRTRKEMKGLEIMVNTGQGRILKGKKWQGIQDKKGDERERNDREYRTKMDMKGQEMTGNTEQVRISKDKKYREYRTSLDIPRLIDRWSNKLKRFDLYWEFYLLERNSLFSFLFPFCRHKPNVKV